MNRVAYIITFVGDKQKPNDGCLAPDTDTENIYTVNGHESERYKGLSTGDAPMQYLMQKAGQEAERISVIAIVSNKVCQKNTAGSSMYEIFRDNLDNFAGALGITDKYDQTSIFPVFYDFDESTGDLITNTNVRTNNIINQIYRFVITASPDAEKSVFIDFTSGFRDASYLMTSVIQFLKVYGIHLKKIVYSNFNDRKIYSLLHITAITDLIQAVNAFGLTGNVKQLREFFDDSYIIDKIGKENSGRLADMKKLLDSFDRFFGCIIINNVNEIDDCKREIEKDMNRLCDSENSPNMYIAMFARLFGIIKKQFFLDGSEEISYPNMIRWCLNHDLINQALTLYVEKMPEEYFKSSLIRSIYDPAAAAKETDTPSYGKSLYADGFYSEIYDTAINRIKLKDNAIPLTLEMRILREIIKEFKDQEEEEIKRPENSHKRLPKVIKWRFQKRTSDLRWKKLPEYTGEGIPLALQRISTALIKNFDNEGWLRSEFNCYDEYFTGQISALDFLNRVVTVYPKIIHYYLRKNSDEYEELKFRIKNTYLKKIDAISDLFSCAVINDSIIRLGNIMKYYLYVKIMRNRISHAQDDTQTRNRELKVQEEALAELSRDSYGLIPLDTAFDFETIKRMLLKGLELPIPD